MVKKVFKYELRVASRSSINMPKGAEILTAQVQFDTPCIWALVNPDTPTEERFFRVFGTGHQIQYDMGIEFKYIGTFQVDGGSYVFHVFEEL